MFNFNFSHMLSFTIIKSQKSTRYYIYNAFGTELAQATSLEQCLNYFYKWCVKLACKSVTFSPTRDVNVIFVKMD